MGEPLRIRRRDGSAWLLAGVLAVAAVPALAQKYDVGPDTQLRIIEFEFDGSKTLSEEDLRKQIASPMLGKHTTLRRWFGFLPSVDPVEPAPFEPLEFQRDVARLREFYRRAGFPDAMLDYTVQKDVEKNTLDIRLRIREGPSLRLASITVTAPDSAALAASLPAELHADWRELEADLKHRIDDRCGEIEVRSIENQVSKWFQDRGYPYVQVRSATTVDPERRTIAVRVIADSGIRARFGHVEVAGTQKVKPDVVRRTIPFKSGDWYSAGKLTEAQQQLINLNLFHLAVTEIPEQPRDSTVEVRVRVEEGKPRLVSGEFGYLSDGGLTFKAEWSHRNFYGKARLLTVSLVSQTGIWAIEDTPDELLRGSVSLTQRGVLGKRVSLITAPYIDYRDDYRDRSASLGVDATLLYVRDSWVRTASLKYGISARQVLDYRSGSGGDVDIFTLIQAALDSTGRRTTHSALTAATTLGRQDHPIRPLRLLLFRPSLEITVPSAWNSAEYSRADLTTTLQHPLREGTLIRARASFGRIWPFGASVRRGTEAEELQRYLDLREYLFTAGGTSDVRGWPSQLLGPKTPDYFVPSGADSGTVRADRYVPFGGKARLSVSGELRLPFPGLSRGWGIHVFLDGGKVWQTDSTAVGVDPYDQERMFWSTGFGLDRDTPVGPIRLSVGYKLNFTPLDVYQPQEFIDDVNAGRLGERPYPWTRRLAVHLAFGTNF